MRMSNSSLVTYKHICKHRDSGRQGNKITKIFVHHMAGNLTVKQCGNVFDNRPASAHYGVNGAAIGQYVDEKDTAWHCGNWGWNTKSIGIELANDGGANWHVSDATIETAIRLIADICKRNGIPKLVYTGNMEGNLCMHRWVCSTSCPGPYLSTQFNRICTQVNILLGKEFPSPFGKLEEDGIGGPDTIGCTQRFLGTEMDFCISGQEKSMLKYLPAFDEDCIDFDNVESTMVKHLQWLVQSYEDGVLGPDTVKCLQRFLGVGVDGIWGPVTMKAWQHYLNTHEKAVYPSTHAPKPGTVKAPVNVSASDKIAKAIAIAKAYAADNSYIYVVYNSKNAKTKQCPDCHHLTGKYKGFNCIRFVYTCWAHAGIPVKHDGGLINNGKAEKMYKGSISEATKIARSALGCQELEVIRNKKGISQSKMKPGDACYVFSGNTYKHTFLYIGNGKMVDCGRYGSKNKEIAVRDAQKCRMIVRYTGK